MTSKLFKPNAYQTVTASIPRNDPFTRKLINAHSLSIINLTQYKHQHYRFFGFPLRQIHESRRISSLSPTCSLSSATPPASKEEAITQAKISLSSALEKPLNNPKLAGKMKKLKQPRFRIEIPVIDDSPSSLVELAIEVFGDMPIKRKGSKINILIFWSNQSLKEAATEAFGSHNGSVLVESADLSSVFDSEEKRNLSSADVAVFLAPEASELAVIKTVTENLNPKPVVLFNPKWAFEEESDFDGLGGFLSSFEVLYSFMGLEVKGIFSKRKGVIFKRVKDGVTSGERWNVLVEEEGELKAVSSFKARPSIIEVETVLYNLMAINSPITKSAKFLKDLVSNATGKK
ncbi:OLC1v1022851C1 [Oldenlandia corymbosa var. corymbosa]|uniref:OLC1v1022851C1 n=1 Tax=Oldenlandia corymbosa var. corymbosa TaxID=529605 RepID=A0AAV1C175_OLDCO|nr:OLC1v1022851C1 [Oldenlandia corymbosa var. corymbosa]